MVRKSLNAFEGIKCSTVFDGNTKKKKPKRYTAESPLRIKNCLNCTKPAKDCKGNCYGKDV